MKIYKLMKILSSQNKARIITHFWDCNCVEENCVADLQRHLKLTQSNLSKHIASLLSDEILLYKRKHKKKFYYINPEFKKSWLSIVDPIVNSDENTPFKCMMCERKKTTNEQKK